MPRPDRSDRPDRPDRSDGPDRHDRHDRPNRSPQDNPEFVSQQGTQPSRRPIAGRDKVRLFFFLGLLASAVLYSAYNLYVLDPYVYPGMGRGVRHIYKFGSLILAWLIGFLVFRRIAAAWLAHLWNTLYAASIGILVILALYDAIIHNLPLSLRQPVSTFHEALISPIPYVVIGLLNFAMRRQPSA